MELSMKDYLNIVVPSNILDPTELLQVMIGTRDSSNRAGRVQCRNSRKNNMLMSFFNEIIFLFSFVDSEKYVEENIATIEHGAKTISGENATVLLNGNFTNYGLDTGTMWIWVYFRSSLDFPVILLKSSLFRLYIPSDKCNKNS